MFNFTENVEDLRLRAACDYSVTPQALSDLIQPQGDVFSRTLVS